MAKRKRKSVTQQIMQDAIRILDKYQHDLTRQQYIRDFKRFVKYCREKHNCRNLEECKKFIQEYVNYLTNEKQLSASTIHTYLSSICSVYNIQLSRFNKPVRHCAEYIRGRSQKLYPDSSQDFFMMKNQRLYLFQKAVGLRRNELRNLRGNDFLIDESGYPCVRVRNGKGGKFQLQRIKDEDVELVKSYFTSVASDEKIFTKAELDNHLNLHSLRAASARNYYFYLLYKVRNEPGFREQLESEVKLRWDLYNIDKKTGQPKPFDEKLIKGEYVFKGKNRELAIKKDRPIKMDKLCLLATSMMKLSHYRLNVAAVSYMLA